MYKFLVIIIIIIMSVTNKVLKKSKGEISVVSFDGLTKILLVITQSHKAGTH